MQLKNNIFAWVSLATLAPLTALVLGATLYSQRLYQQKVASEVSGTLNTIVAEIDRRLLFERQMLRALAEAPAVMHFVPVVVAASQGQLHPEFFPRSERTNRFLEDFQAIVGSFNTLRVLDVDGNTLVKVRGGESSPAIFDGIESFPYAEEELDDPAFLRRLRELTPGEVGVTLLTQASEDEGREDRLPMMDYVIPLAASGSVIGYLAASISGEQIDRILEVAPRLHAGKLLIGEINPGQPDRDGLLLYDDARKLRFADIKSTNTRLQNILDGRLWSAAQDAQQSTVKTIDGATVVWFVQALPYPNLLAHWVVAARIEDREITAPFQRIRLAIALFAVLALLLSLWFARMSAGRIARPVSRLAGRLKAYGEGQYRVRMAPEGSDEIQQLGQAFNYMADSLDTARGERDRAQALMLQNAKLASLGQMAAGIGHELNNPLGNILSYAKLIERGLPDTERGPLSDVVALREEALRASRIVQGVLNFARRVPPEYTRFEAAQWLQESIGLVRQAAKARGVELRSRPGAGHLIEGDRGQLQQALVNLLLNAIQASAAGGAVEVDLRARERELEVSVRDHGVGIDQAILDRVFDPFFTTKSVGEGSGLGLSISLGIVQHHGGTLHIANHRQGGAVATICLPTDRSSKS